MDLVGRVVIPEEIEQAVENSDSFIASSLRNAEHGIAVTQNGATNCLGGRTPVAVGQRARRRPNFVIQ